MTSPFDDAQTTYHVLRNAEQQYALWPVFAGTPAGWVVVHGPAGQSECLEFVREHWTDLRPDSLVRQLGA